MKIFSTVTAAALLLGAGALMHAPSASAEIDGCPQLAQECNAGNQEACHLYAIGCKGKAAPGSNTSGASPANINRKQKAAASK
jgi:hypothetical protein